MVVIEETSQIWEQEGVAHKTSMTHEYTPVEKSCRKAIRGCYSFFIRILFTVIGILYMR
jgi:hypothetical protein